MFCKKCGNPMNDDEKFCKKCGTPVGEAGEKPAAQTKPQPKTAAKANEKTKLGISVCLVAAIAYFCCLSGYAALVLVLIAGYVLLAEENVFLRKSVVKAIVVAGCFMLLKVAIGLVPTFFTFLDNLLGIFETGFGHATVNAILATLGNILYFVKIAIVVLLGVFALGGKTIRLPVIDNLIDKCVK